MWRRFGWGYAAYAAVVIAIPIIGTKDFMGTGRYVLAAFPVIAAAGDFLTVEGGTIDQTPGQDGVLKLAFKRPTANADSGTLVTLDLEALETGNAPVLVLNGKLDADDVSVIFSEKQQIIKKSGLLEYYEATEDFSNVAGLDNLKQWLTKRRIAFTDRAARFGLSPPRGVMLLGVYLIMALAFYHL